MELRALSGFWVTFGQLLVYKLYRFNRGLLRWLGIVPLAGFAVQGGAYLLDRIDRADNSPGDDNPADDARLAQLRRSFELLAGEGAAGADRAERVQTIFSLPYDENWQKK